MNKEEGEKNLTDLPVDVIHHIRSLTPVKAYIPIVIEFYTDNPLENNREVKTKLYIKLDDQGIIYLERRDTGVSEKSKYYTDDFCCGYKRYIGAVMRQHTQYDNVYIDVRFAKSVLFFHILQRQFDDEEEDFDVQVDELWKEIDYLLPMIGLVYQYE